MYFFFPNNTVFVSDYVIKSFTYSGIVLYSAPGLDPRDMPLPGHNRLEFNNGLITSFPYTSPYSAQGIIGRDTSIIFSNLEIYGSENGVSFSLGQAAGRGRLPMGRNIYIEFENSELNVLYNGFRFYEESQLLFNNSFIFKNISVNSLSNPGNNAFSFIFEQLNGILVSQYKEILIYLDTVEVNGFYRGFMGRIYYPGFKNIWFENFFFNNRRGIGVELDMSDSIFDRSPSNPDSIDSLDELNLQEDIYFAYSILWNVSLSYRNLGIGVPSESLVIFESVYDELTSTSIGFTVYSIWTLETLVYSKSLKIPLNRISVMYDVTPYDYASGYTDSAGSYRYRFTYTYDGSIGFIDSIYVEARDGWEVASTWYIPYINDTYTMPSWYGRIILYLDIVAFKAIGFSHKTGTTLLMINGYTGFLNGYYSMKPYEIEIYREMGNRGKAYTSYPIRVNQVYIGHDYLIIYSEILFDGYWQPYTLAVNLRTLIVYSTGPIDFRGVIISS